MSVLFVLVFSVYNCEFEVYIILFMFSGVVLKVIWFGVLNI